MKASNQMILPNMCNKIIPDNKMMFIHQKSHSRRGKVSFECDFCGISYASKTHLQKHILDKHEVQTETEVDSTQTMYKKTSVFECEICNKRFVRKRHYLNHTNKCYTNLYNLSMNNEQLSLIL